MVWLYPEFGMCFEKKKKSLEKEALKVKYATTKHIQAEREILASDMAEMKKMQAKICSIQKENEGMGSVLNAAMAEYQKQRKLIERELIEAQNEYTKNVQAILAETAEFEMAEDEAVKVNLNFSASRPEH
jgi:pyridoxal/pyridoxine/pyridoxamine kinase